MLVQNQEDEYDLLEGADGLTGIALARYEQPDIILMDLWLPVSTAGRRRRGCGATRTAWIPIVAVTAHAMAGAEDRARSCGCDDYLRKAGRRAAAADQGA